MPVVAQVASEARYWLAQLCRARLLGSQANFLHLSRASSSTQSGDDLRHACLDSTRAVVAVQGKQAIQFLQGMVTNDLRPLEQPGARPVYATILTPKGKFLHDVICYQHPENQGSVLMEVDAAGADNAIKWLERYKLRRPLTIRNVSSEYRVWCCWSASAEASQALTQPAGPGWYQDPRLPGLGLRAVLPAAPPSLSSDASSTSQPPSPAPQGSRPASSADEYKALRCRLGVAEGEVEIPTGSAAPLEYNTDVLNGVSYTKGCYIGQERNSFTHYRGIIRRRLMPCSLSLLPTPGAGAGSEPTTSSAGSVSSSSSTSSAASAVVPPEGLLAPGLDVRDPSGQVVGQLRAVVGSLGLVHIKLTSALAAASGQLQLTGQGQGAAVVVVPHRPAWWPAEWGYEEAAEQPRK